MQRREFLRLAALGFMVTPLAACMPGGHDHGNGSAAGHQHGVSGTAANTPDWAAALPQHQPLQALPRIANQASAPQFRATLNMQPTRVPLTADVSTELWLYNGKVAPLIEITEGDQVEVVANNHLAQPTTIHWHGVKVPVSEDGGPHDLIPSHGSRTYRFTVPEGNSGLHWFHPHPHNYLAEQIAHSLAGALLVRPKQDPMPAAIPSYLLMVTDLRLDADARVAPHTGVDWMNGREGDILLVNGQRNPRLDVVPGSTFRLRMVNACAGRYLRLQLEDHGLQLIGTDGGYLEQPVALNELLLVPGQRCDLLVRASERKGQTFALQKLPYDRDWMGPVPAHYTRTETLLTLHTSNADVQSVIPLPARLTSIPSLGEPAVQRKVVLSEEMPGHAMGGATDDHVAHGGQTQQPGHDAHADHGSQGGHGMMAGGHGMMSGGHGGHGMMAGGHGDHGMMGGGMLAERPPIRFMINGETFKPGRILFEGRVGQVEEWEVFNESHMDHPFHVHGTQFQVVAVQDAGGNWQPPAWRSWQDTINLKPNQRQKIRLVFEQPGEWMFHCHIIEHEELGMMASILVK
ncbi:multicopper oxidase family protein [Marinospirillum alkaliphilum]|uniref:Multicopper oxidase n=1 Tax=Marinospirillum alkaliphilum DSM 21637 TaxID=1122209 RepID=A0A1K1V374_9GAMM|nr:multicopper oxidase family protein [Marinospirillum alkaliphilum]SFX19228.1 Multicopper oxidase [Marinospirillum alkaliphilum DSM 21637]